MIWYNITKLEDRLIAKTLQDKAVFNYLLAYFVLATILAYAGEDGYNYDLLRWMDLALDLVVTIIGITITWRTNLNGDNSHYFIRFISLSFVYAIRVGIKFILTSILLYLLINMFAMESLMTGTTEDLIDIAMGTIFQIIFYYRLNQSFTRVSAVGETAEVSNQ